MIKGSLFQAGILLYKLINEVRKVALSSKRYVCLIKLDNIGDYLLFRNYISVVRENERQGILFILNKAVEDIFLSLDYKKGDKYILVCRKRFLTSRIYRLKIYFKLSIYNIEKAISPVYSRENILDQFLNNLNTKTKIGSSGNSSNISEVKLINNKSIYTQLIEATNKVIFEFYRNLEFFEGLYKRKLFVTFGFVPDNTRDLTFDFNYIVLFISASAPEKKWCVQNFKDLTELISKSLDIKYLICGSFEDYEVGKELEKKIGQSCINLVGKTSITELVPLVKRAKATISGDTFITHLCASVDTYCVTIYSGLHLNRFLPYPNQLSNKVILVAHPEIEKNQEEYQKVSNSDLKSFIYSINEITPKKVFNVLKQNFKWLN